MAMLPGQHHAWERYRDRQLRLVGVLYFTAGFSGAAFGRVATLYFIARHLTPSQIGALSAIQPIVGAAGNQVFGWVADQLLLKKAVAVAGRVVSTPGSLRMAR